MIDALIAVLDRLIQLADYRNRRLRLIFDEVLTPIFQDLTEVHTEYGKLFQEMRRFFPGGKLPYSPYLGDEVDYAGHIDLCLDVSEAVELLRNERRRFEPVRLRLMQMLLAADYSHIRSPAAQHFIDSVIRYFPRGCGLAEISNLPFQKRRSLPESTAGLLASDDNWSKHLLAVLEDYRRGLELSPAVDPAEHAAVIDLVQFFIRWGYSDVCGKYATLKMEAARST